MCGAGHRPQLASITAARHPRNSGATWGAHKQLNRRLLPGVTLLRGEQLHGAAPGASLRTAPPGTAEGSTPGGIPRPQSSMGSESPTSKSAPRSLNMARALRSCSCAPRSHKHHPPPASVSPACGHTISLDIPPGWTSAVSPPSFPPLPQGSSRTEGLTGIHTPGERAKARFSSSP